MLISIIIPSYNEINTLEIIVNKILLQKKLKKEIILVNDGSTDGTKKIINSKLYKKVNKVIHHKYNKGKGAAIKSAAKIVKGDIILIQDADLEYNPKDYFKLINPIIKKKSLVVYGSRVLGKKRYSTKGFTSLLRIFFNHFLTSVSNVINSQSLTDAHTCYKAFHKSVFAKIKLSENDFSFCPEITTKVSNLGHSIFETKVSYSGRSYKEGKKIGVYDGLKAIYVLFKYKFFCKNY
jgi:glycosyltransferase involved in cell wall biosynthesis